MPRELIGVFHGKPKGLFENVVLLECLRLHFRTLIIKLH